MSEDCRFILSQNSENLGVYKNIEKALNEVDGWDVDFVALSDQDDIWSVDKLNNLLTVIEKDSQNLLAHSDARIIDENSKLIKESLWNYEQRNPNLKTSSSLLHRNSVTGCCLIFRKKLLKWALKFPNQKKIEFHHDLWLALIASLYGEIIYSEEKLIDYRFHRKNLVGPKLPTKLKFLCNENIFSFLLRFVKPYRVRAEIASELRSRKLCLSSILSSIAFNKIPDFGIFNLFFIFIYMFFGKTYFLNALGMGLRKFVYSLVLPFYLMNDILYKKQNV